MSADGGQSTRAIVVAVGAGPKAPTSVSVGKSAYVLGACSRQVRAPGHFIATPVCMPRAIIGCVAGRPAAFHAMRGSENVQVWAYPAGGCCRADGGGAGDAGAYAAAATAAVRDHQG